MNCDTGYATDWSGEGYCLEPFWKW